MHQILNHIIAAWMPVWLICLLSTQLFKCALQAFMETGGHNGVRFDDDVLARIESVSEACVFEESSLAPQLGDTLGRTDKQNPDESRNGSLT